jgi:hypothetical protein
MVVVVVTPSEPVNDASPSTWGTCGAWNRPSRPRPGRTPPPPVVLDRPARRGPHSRRTGRPKQGEHAESLGVVLEVRQHLTVVRMHPPGRHREVAERRHHPARVRVQGRPDPAVTGLAGPLSPSRSPRSNTTGSNPSEISRTSARCRRGPRQRPRRVPPPAEYGAVATTYPRSR